MEGHGVVKGEKHENSRITLPYMNTVKAAPITDEVSAGNLIRLEKRHKFYPTLPHVSNLR